MAASSTSLESLRVGDAVIVDDASPESALCRVTKITRSQIVCGRRRYSKANGMPVRGACGYGIRPATLADFQRVARAISRSQRADRARPDSPEDTDGDERPLLGQGIGDGDREPWDIQTIEQLQGMAGWLDAAGS